MAQSVSGAKILILGAGPTGLSAGFHLRQAGESGWLMCEQNAGPGGLAASYTQDGFTFDFGGHILYSSHPDFHAMLEAMMPGGLLDHVRQSWIYAYHTWLPYPFQNNAHLLPAPEAYDCLSGALRAYNLKDSYSDTSANFKEWVIRTFGEGIARHFMLPYNEKIWAIAPEALNYDWIKERISVINGYELLNNYLTRRTDPNWGPNFYFKYPATGGIGRLFKTLAAALDSPGRIFYRRKAIAVDPARRRVSFADGSEIEYHRLISTMPLPELLHLCLNLDWDIKRAAGEFKSNRVTAVGLGLKGEHPGSRHWIYFPEAKYPFYRVSYLYNYSPAMTPGPDYFSILAEVSHSQWKPRNPEAIVDEVIAGLEAANLLAPASRKDIVTAWSREEPRAYPIPSLNRDAALEKVMPYLENHGIYSRGRLGSWKYELGNMDHAFMLGKDAAQQCLAAA